MAATPAGGDSGGVGVTTLPSSPHVHSPLTPSSPLTQSPLPAGYVPVPVHSALRVQPRVIDPYEPQPEFDLPWLGRIGLFLIDVILVPLRLISAIILLVTLWAICRVLTIGVRPAQHAGDPPFGPLRTWLIRSFVRLLSIPFCWCFGLVVSHARHPDARVGGQGVLVANHIGYVEILALVAAYTPSVVAKAEVANYPLMGTIARALQCVFLDRKDPQDRERVRLLMRVRAQQQSTVGSGASFPPLLLFPEGTTGNGAALLRMQKGIFAAGAPVQPIAIRTHFCYFNSGWCRDSMGAHVLMLLSRLYHPVSLQELPLYTPSAAERSDAVLYADNVGQTMANALGIPLSSKSMFDNPELQATIKRREHKERILKARKSNTKAESQAAAARAEAAAIGRTTQETSVALDHAATAASGDAGGGHEVRITVSAERYVYTSAPDLHPSGTGTGVTGGHTHVASASLLPGHSDLHSLAAAGTARSTDPETSSSMGNSHRGSHPTARERERRKGWGSDTQMQMQMQPA